MKNIHFTKTTGRQGLYLAFVIISLALSGNLAQAATECYDFEKPAVGTQYRVGDTVNAAHSVITLYPLFDEALQPGARDGHAEITELNLLQTPPSLRLASRISLRIVPQKRIKRVTLNYAENTGADNNQLLNLGVNGELRAWRGTLSVQNGQHMGTIDAGGQVNVSVTHQAGGGNWVTGTLTLESDPVFPWLPGRGIETIMIGRSSQLILDKVCLSTS